MLKVVELDAELPASYACLGCLKYLRHVLVHVSIFTSPQIQFSSYSSNADVDSLLIPCSKGMPISYTIHLETRKCQAGKTTISELFMKFGFHELSNATHGLVSRPLASNMEDLS